MDDGVISASYAQDLPVWKLVKVSKLFRNLQNLLLGWPWKVSQDKSKPTFYGALLQQSSNLISEKRGCKDISNCCAITSTGCLRKISDKLFQSSG